MCVAEEPPRGSYAIKYVCTRVCVCVCVCLYVCKSCAIDGKCPNLSLRLYLRMRGELMLEIFGLKIRPF